VTGEDVQSLLLEIETALANTYKENLPRPRISRRLTKLLAGGESLSTLKAKLSKLPVVSLCLASWPSGGLVDKLSSWVRVNVAKGAILEIKTDESLVGGAVISFGGRFCDLSLARKIREILATEKEKIFAELNEQG
jgi:F0F1-type ATP synthase delta subunit